MRLVFVHGWGLAPEMWDALAQLLPLPQIRVDLGFFGDVLAPEFCAGDVLIGHSLGFLWGAHNFADWGGAVAINGFGRFLRSGDQGCIAAGELRALRLALSRDPDAAVTKFRDRLGLAAAQKPAQKARLMAGLDFLRDVSLDAPLAAPQLTLAARDDVLVPETESARLGGAATLWREHGGHGLPWTAPEFCARAILTFLDARHD